MILQVIAAFVIFLARQIASVPKEVPTVTVTFPAQLQTKSVEAWYYLRGPFGGYGTNTSDQTGQNPIKISADVEGRPADNIKLVVYATGCEFQTFDVDLTRDSHPTLRFECVEVTWVFLSGQIQPVELVRNRKTRIAFMYSGFWKAYFFHLGESLDSPYKIAEATPDSDGKFHVQLPYFGGMAAPDPKLLIAGLGVELVDGETVTRLRPKDRAFMSEICELQIRKSYPDNLEFVQDKHKQVSGCE
jgi:hypothetical protein